MPTFILPQLAPVGLLLLVAAMALVFGLARASDAVLKMRDSARNRHVREAQLIAQARAEVGL